MLSHRVLGHRVLGHRMLGHRMPGHRMLGHRMPARLVLLIAAGLISLAALPAAPALGAAAAPADGIRTNQQWVLDMLDAEAAWSVTRGAGVTIAVIDSGVNPYVSDLSGSVITGPDYTGVSTRPSSMEWGVHGTWMASLIAGHGHDGGFSGVVGIAPAARILSIRVIPDRADPHYGKYERERETAIQQSLADGIRYAVTHGAKVISMSIGYSAPNGAVRAELQDAYDHGVVVIASAGNSGDPGSSRGHGAPESFPANYPSVISVGAVNSSAGVASFSSDNLSVQVAAPGVSVPAQGRDGQYWSVSGTSPACALVAGVAALIKSRYPDLPPDLVASAMTSTASHRPPGGYDSQVGFGIADAAAALTRAGQLGGHRPAVIGIKATARYHGALLPEPVGPRSSGQLILFTLLALTSLVLIAAAATRLAILAPGEPVTRPAHDAGPPPVDDFASSVLDVVDSIPPGRVMSYGAIAEYLGAGRGPRQVGRVMAVYGGAVAWWRVIHADGTPAPGHDSVALRHYLAEGTPLRSARPPVRVDMRRARWPGGHRAPKPALHPLHHVRRARARTRCEHLSLALRQQVLMRARIWPAKDLRVRKSLLRQRNPPDNASRLSRRTQPHLGAPRNPRREANLRMSS